MGKHNKFTTYAYQYSIAQTRALAASGDAGAQFELGRRYDFGDDIEPDELQARKLYKKAAEQNHVRALNNLANMYLHKKGAGAEKDKKEGMALIAKALAIKSPDHKYPLALLGISYLFGHGTKQNTKKAIELLLQAAEQQHPIAMYYLAGYFIAPKTFGDDEAPQLARALDFLNQAIALGEPGSMLLKAYLLHQHYGNNANLSEIVTLLSRADSLGEKKALPLLVKALHGAGKQQLAYKYSLQLAQRVFEAKEE